MAITKGLAPTAARKRPVHAGGWLLEESLVKEPMVEDPDYLSRQLITCIGNKRALLGPIATAVEAVKQRLGKSKLRTFDAFSGSGIVSRFLKAHSELLVSNDIEDYATTISRCFLRNQGEVDFDSLSKLVADLNHRAATEPFPTGFIEELYSPRDEANITVDDRVFYTKDNARRLDIYRRLIDTALEEFRDLLLGPLLSEASIHVNTAGVFKGFYKNGRTGLGQFGGAGSDALFRITGAIQLEPPLLSRFDCDFQVLQEDAIDAAKRVRGMELDLAYFDPPYNQHPYGSNYFMLNLLVEYRRPVSMSRVAGIPGDWKRSGFNVRSRSLPLMKALLEATDAAFLLVSFNNEGFISPEAMLACLQELGSVTTIEIPYNAFRGSRNFTRRSLHVVEQLFLVERR